MENNKKIRYILSLLVIVAGIGSIVFSRLNEATIDANGVIHEPFFFLGPLGYLLLTIGVITILLTLIKQKK